ncbi:cutinase family protein [Kitasatospora sp. NPDC048239]|uniref:cutinase family protein n=1 Tax=Kitasatospora sp. NPDC048239 TaxID=3364046 RepID=UPI003715A457
MLVRKSANLLKRPAQRTAGAGLAALVLAVALAAPGSPGAAAPALVPGPVSSGSVPGPGSATPTTEPPGPTLPCTPWAFIGVRGVVGPNDDITNKSGGMPGPFLGLPGLMNDQVVPQLQDALGGAQNLAVGWVDYEPSTYEHAFLTEEVAKALASADTEAKARAGSTRDTLNPEGTAHPELLPKDLRETESQGAGAAAEQIANQATACPDQHLVLAGYSEGAWVLGDALQYSAIPGGEPALQPYYDRIDEVLLYGDPMFDSDSPAAHSPDQPGARKALGIAARALGAARHPYLPAQLESRAQSSCYGGPDTVDPICATPGGREGQRASEPSEPVTDEEWVRALGPDTCRPRDFAGELAALANCGHLKYQAVQWSGHVPTGDVRRTTMTVASGTPGWLDTGVSVRRGQSVTIAHGAGGWTVDTRLQPEVGLTGPQGYSRADDANILPGCKIVDSAPYGALLAAVGSGSTGTGPPSPVTWAGEGGQVQAQADGRLLLRINDQDRCLGDNSGLVVVTVQK